MLNRIVRWTDQGIEYEADPRQVEKLMRDLKIDDADKDLKTGRVLGAGSYGVVSEGMYHGTRVAVKKLHVSNLPEEMLIEFHRRYMILFYFLRYLHIHLV